MIRTFSKSDDLKKDVSDVCLKNGPYPFETEATRKRAKCRFCGDVAVAIYEFSEGCQAQPNWKIQALCVQHELKASPIGTMTLIWRRDDLDVVEKGGANRC